MSRYTLQRLENALLVFRDGQPYECGRSSKSDEEETCIKKSRKRRSVAIDARLAASWQDKDESGDFDPSAERRKSRIGRILSTSLSQKRVFEASPLSQEFARPAKRKKSLPRGYGEPPPSDVVVLKTSLGKLEALVPILDDNERALEGPRYSRFPAFHNVFQQTGIESQDFVEHVMSTETTMRSGKVRLQPVFKKSSIRCKECYDNGRSCNYRSKDKSMCTPCQKERRRNPGIQCIPCETDAAAEDEDAKSLENLRTGSESKKSHQRLMTPPPTPSWVPPSIPPQAPMRTQVITITTRFAHPFNYDFEPKNDALGRKCHFCDKKSYGLYGLQLQKNLKVLKTGDSVQYKEPRNFGNVAAGFEPSRMCLICALNRLMISSCPGHQWFTTKDPKTIDHSYAFSLEGMQKTTWCSICVEPAVVACCSLQDDNKIAGILDSSGKKRRGCRMQLCLRCYRLMQGTKRSSLEMQTLIEKSKRQSLRADFEFLFPGSDLHKHYQAFLA